MNASAVEPDTVGDGAGAPRVTGPVGPNPQVLDAAHSTKIAAEPRALVNVSGHPFRSGSRTEKASCSLGLRQGDDRGSRDARAPNQARSATPQIGEGLGELFHRESFTGGDYRLD
jgi:hypothetical protein